jgi:catechol 2,3-dioxygenase-like lactoylglutathione lyase family enzyme
MLLHADLFVRSLEASLEFYCEKLGFSLIEEVHVEGAVVRFMSNDCFDAMRIAIVSVCPVGAKIELMELPTESARSSADFMPAPHSAALTILVPDLAIHIAALKIKDVRPASGTFKVRFPGSGDCSVVFYRDPDGHLLEFVEIHG